MIVDSMAKREITLIRGEDGFDQIASADGNHSSFLERDELYMGDVYFGRVMIAGNRSLSVAQGQMGLFEYAARVVSNGDGA